MSPKETPEYCEMCGGQIDPENHGSDPEGVKFCADCTWDAKHQKKSACGREFTGQPLRPGKPFRCWYCGRPKGHPGRHAAHFPGAAAGEYASVVWWAKS